MQTTLYGIPHCDTVKKARVWLARQDLEWAFHDFKKQGLARATVKGWLAQVPWEVLVNRKGSTWRGLPDQRRAAIVDAASALDLMVEFPSVVKRPVLHHADQIHIGFSDAQYQHIFTL